MNISELPEPYKSMAEKMRKEHESRNPGSTRDTIYGGFQMDTTKEGFSFWNNVNSGKYPEITEEIKSYHPDIFKEEPKQGLPEEFGIRVENNTEASNAVSWLVSLGFLNNHSYEGSVFGSSVYYVKANKVIECDAINHKNITVLEIFTLEEAKQMIQQKPVQVEEKEIIGYLSPMELFGSLPEGTLFVKRQKEDNWYHNKDSEVQIVPKEIVEGWIPVYKETYKEGDLVIVWIGETKYIAKYKSEGTMYDWATYVGVKPERVTSIGTGGFDRIERLAIPQETTMYEDLKNKVELTLGSNNRNISIKKDGKISIGSEYTHINVVRAIIDDHTTNCEGRVVGTSWKVSVDENVRFIRIGCLTENNLFSIQDLKNVVNAHKKLSK